jgi:hypothetical protein
VNQLTVNPVFLASLHASDRALQIDANRRHATKKPGGVITEYAAAQYVQKSRCESPGKLPIRSLQWFSWDAGGGDPNEVRASVKRELWRLLLEQRRCTAIGP